MVGKRKSSSRIDGLSPSGEILNMAYPEPFPTTAEPCKLSAQIPPLGIAGREWM